MRILYLNAYLDRFDFWTGQRGRELVDALRNAGLEVQTLPCIPPTPDQEAAPVSASSSGFKRYIKTKLPKKWLILLVELYLIARGIARTARLPIQVWRRRRDARPDLVLARSFEYEWGPWIVAKFLKRPLVLEVHAPFFVERQFRGREDSRFFRWYEGVLWRRAARVWVHTRELERIVADNEVEPERIRVIPFGVGCERLGEPVHRHNAGQVQVVFVGSFYPWHGVEVLIEALAIARVRSSKLHLCLIGDGVTRTINEEKVKELGIENYVEFTGWLSKNEVAIKLDNSDIGVAPYMRLEPFYFEPVKILDYMAANLAIVASDLGQVRELITHGDSGLLVPPEDVSALAAALVELAEDPDLRRGLGLAARERVPTWDDTARRVHSLCAEVVSADMTIS